MNKDVIYIEPDDDITDIIAKIENSKAKIVALVPPKKAGVFRSVVNIKLIAKAGASAKKTIVLVTTDPSIIRLAAAVKIPVTKDLQSAPSVPTLDQPTETTEKEDLTEEAEEGSAEEDSEKTPEKTAENEEEIAKPNQEDTEEDSDPDDEASGLKISKKSESSKNKKGIGAWILGHKKTVIFGSLVGILLILALVWALVIAPAAIVTVGIKTTTNNFSENVTFTTTLDEENAETGKFYLTEKKIEEVNEVEFEATGTKNVGERATGEVVIYGYFKQKGTIAVNAGSSFTISGLTFVSEKDASLSWDGSDICENNSQASIALSGCLISGRVDVIATEPGESYNIAPSSTGWSTTASVGVYSDSAMTGGTNKTITVVQQSDIDKAKAEINSSNEDANKEKLYEMIPEGSMAINSSFKQATGDAISTPAIGEEVKEGEKATLKVTTTASVFMVDETKIEEFISNEAKLSESQKIYEMKSPFIENFVQSETGYSGKLKTSYAVGPKITENQVVEIIKGRGLGEAQHDLRDIEGITAVRIDPSYPWVMSIPNDPNKITVILEVKD